MLSIFSPARTMARISIESLHSTATPVSQARRIRNRARRMSPRPGHYVHARNANSSQSGRRPKRQDTRFIRQLRLF